MSSSHPEELLKANLLYDLCLQLSKSVKGVNITHLLDLASKTLDDHETLSTSTVNEFVVIEGVKRKLSLVGKEEVATFRDLHRKLNTHVITK